LRKNVKEIRKKQIQRITGDNAFCLRLRLKQYWQQQKVDLQWPTSGANKSVLARLTKMLQTPRFTPRVLG
jgi:hypothetical protein